MDKEEEDRYKGGMKTTRQLYSQYLLSSQINYTCTNLAQHVQGLDENSVYRYLKGDKLTPALLWEQVQRECEQVPSGCLIFDDTLLEKPYGKDIEGVRTQYSGNQHRIMRGIGVVNLVYYNPLVDKYWVIDYRIFDPDRDGKTKLDHVWEMLDCARHRNVQYQTVLMDSWYATSALMMRLIKERKIFYCPIKKNRKVNDQGLLHPYIPAEELCWNKTEWKEGKMVKLYRFAAEAKVKLFRVEVSSHRTEYIVTNEMTQSDVEVAQKVSGQRWKIEQFHREEKQLTGISQCECRKNRSQRNHIACAVLVWNCLKNLAYRWKKTMYQLKHGLLSEYLRQQLRAPTIIFG